jgi:hypothetical protein
VTEWLSRASFVAHRTVRAISSVVRTSANVCWFRWRLYPVAAAWADFRLARVSVSHWCSASATITEPSEKWTS